MYIFTDASLPKDVEGYRFNGTEGNPYRINITTPGLFYLIYSSKSEGVENQIPIYTQDIPKVIKMLQMAYDN